MSEQETEENQETNDDIAIIGMTGRFPKAKNLQQYWQNLRSGKECVRFFTAEELLEAGVSSEISESEGYVNARAILDDAEEFAASFFAMNPKEAEQTDPQHRLFLECVWQALEHAGYDAERYDGLIGVYAGCDINAYALSNLVLGAEGLQTLIGNDKDYLTTRTSFKLNLKGPSVSVQTACSTSLVAVQMGCQSLLSYQSDMALAGGVGIAFPQKAGYFYQEGGILSSDGHCCPFSADAKGTVGGDGIGVVVLKRLADALEDNDTIYAVIKGAALNNDGCVKIGYTAPSVEGQAEVVAMAQALADIDPSSIDYIETHGTGTKLGDPVEISALTDVFQAATDKIGYCAIGSVKGNVGHMNSAAGIGSLLKVILALQHKEMPPSINCGQTNPLIDFDNSPFYVNTQLKPWEQNETPRRAGVSSFGIGGTNAHIIIEEAPEIKTIETVKSHHLLVLSAKSEPALRQSMTNLQHYLEEDAAGLTDIAYTLQAGRALFNYRKIIICEDKDTAINALQNKPSYLVCEPAEVAVVFMFPGQGSQYINMAHDLYLIDNEFKTTLDYCADYLQSILNHDIRDILYATDSEALNQTANTQPILFSIEYSLAKQWIALGVTPESMIGHSIGEYVAACIAGVFSLDAALTLVAARGKLIQATAKGAMLALPLAEEQAAQLPDVSIAALNAPAMTVISGSLEAIEKVSVSLQKEHIESRRLHTSHAFHSKYIDPILNDFRKLLQNITFSPPQIPYLSNLTGTWITAEQATDVEYWLQHSRQTVRFSAGIEELCRDPQRILLEVGPGNSLTNLLKKHNAIASERNIFTTLRHPQQLEHDLAYFLSTLGELYIRNVPIHWPAYYSKQPQRIALPGYPFERETYRINPELQLRQAFNNKETFGKNPNVEKWFYSPSWKRTLFLAAHSSNNAVLLFTHETEVCKEILSQLDHLNIETCTVTPASHYAKISDNQYQINPQSVADYIALLESLKSTNKIPRSFVHAWLTSLEVNTEESTEQFSKTQNMGYFSLLFLTQAIAHVMPKEQLQIDIITTANAVVLGDEIIHPEKATIMGLCKVIPQEYFNLTCRIIDVDANPQKQIIPALVNEITTGITDNTVAYRGQSRWIEHFENINTEKIPQPERLRQAGCYIIIGGLGNIGLILAHYLAETLQAKLVLTSRNGLPPEAEWDAWLQSHGVTNHISFRIGKVRELQALGAQVTILSVDVSEARQMDKMIETTKAQYGTINGIVYSVGNVGEELLKPIHEADKQHSEIHFNSKATGIMNLAKVIPLNLDFCLLFSSLATILGGVGGAAYSAANHYLDAYVRKQNQNQKTQTPWINVNWDAWQPSEESQLTESTMPAWARFAIQRTEGTEAFQRILAHDPICQIVVSTHDLATRLKQLLRSDVSETDDEDLLQEQQSTRHSRPEQNNEYVAPRNEMEKILTEMWEALLGIDKVGVLDNFFKLGGDSLVAIQLSTRIRDVFHIDVTVNDLFDEPTISGLTKRIREFQAQQEVKAQAVETQLDMIENMSEQEVKDMLEKLEE